MPAAISIRERQSIIDRREKGETFATISDALNISYDTARNIYRRFVETGKLGPAYEKCSHPAIRKDENIYHRAVQLKQAHPKWGAGLVWIELAEEFAEKDLPSQRTLQRWFRRAGVQHAPPERKPRVYAQRGKKAHEVWAIDAKEQMELADGTYACWFTITDEGSGAILGAYLFPHKVLDQDRSTLGQICDTTDPCILGLSAEDPNG